MEVWNHANLCFIWTRSCTGMDSNCSSVSAHFIIPALCHPQARRQYRRHLKALVWKYDNFAFMLSMLPHNLFTQIHAHCLLHIGVRRTHGQFEHCTTYNLNTLISLSHLRLHLARGVFPSDFLKSRAIVTIPVSSHEQLAMSPALTANDGVQTPTQGNLSKLWCNYFASSRRSYVSYSEYMLKPEMLLQRQSPIGYLAVST